MAKLKNLWVEHRSTEKKAICIDWDNDRHQRVEIESDTPEDVAWALDEASYLISVEIVDGEI